MIISVAKSKNSTHWTNIEISWEELLDRLSSTVRTPETVEEYRRLPKEKQDEIKNVGGFVGGQLKDGKRKNGFLEFRSVLALDLDYARPEVWEEITLFYDFKCCISSTHKHTAEKPRLRLIIPLLRKVTADEYTAIARKVAEDIGIEQFDDTTYEPLRLMYWPSTSSNGEFVFEKQEGSLLDPDEVLARYTNWRDSSEWPVSSRQKKIVKSILKKQAEPLTKGGVVGAFCRTYSVQEAIETFLSEVYQPSLLKGRYDYIPAESSAGVLIYAGQFAYSHHATDPACGKLCNAFDLVRIHKFGELDPSSEEVDSPTKLPSYQAMQEFCVENERVKRQLAKERLAQANQDFALEEEDWQTRLELNKNGEIKDTLSNIATILRRDQNLQGIVYNQHRDGIDVRGKLPWKQVKEGWGDSDLAGAKLYFDQTYRIWSPGKFNDALLGVASERLYHPIKEYLNTLPEWDGTPRVDTLLIDYLGAEDTLYTRAVLRKTLCAAVARVYEPGTKFDQILVLNGPQGLGKSTFFARLGRKWFSDSLTLSDMRDKAAAEKLQGYWILELGELAGIKKVDVETVKSFISRTDDKYRASYGFNVESHPRQCVIVGSTNSKSGFLRDITGNRRFWPVKVYGHSVKKPWEMNEVDQSWAEVLVKYRAGEELFLKGSEAQMATAEQTCALEADDREGLVREYLDRLLPEKWREMDLFERRSFLSEGHLGSRVQGTVRRERVCTMELWCECFGKEGANLRKSDAYEMNAILSRIEGWEKYEGNKRGNFKFPLYGVQAGYVRVESPGSDDVPSDGN
jgi:putative DNA primase/helicase